MRDDLKLAAFAVASGFTLDTDRAGRTFGPDCFDTRGVPHDGLQFQRKGIHVWDTARGWRVAAMAGDRFEPIAPEQFHRDLFKALQSAIARGDAPGNRAPSPHTVLFYVDGDHGVATFCEHVTSTPDQAFDDAVAKVRASGNHFCRASELDNATEIATYAGHLRNA